MRCWSALWLFLSFPLSWSLALGIFLWTNLLNDILKHAAPYLSHLLSLVLRLTLLGLASFAPTPTRHLRPHWVKVHEQPVRIPPFREHGGELVTSQKGGTYLKEHKQPFRVYLLRGMLAFCSTCCCTKMYKVPKKNTYMWNCLVVVHVVARMKCCCPEPGNEHWIKRHRSVDPGTSQTSTRTQEAVAVVSDLCGSARELHGSSNI